MPVDMSGLRINPLPQDRTLSMLRSQAEGAKNAMAMELEKRTRERQIQEQEMQSTADNAQFQNPENPMDSKINYLPSQSESKEYSPMYEGNYRITQQFGNYNPALYAGITADGRHKGLDIALPKGTQLSSPTHGRARAGTDKSWGNYVLIEGVDGNEYRMSHLSQSHPLFRQAQGGWVPVQAGQVIGQSGSTGNSTGAHLDISTRRGGKFIDPLSIPALERYITGV